MCKFINVKYVAIGLLLVGILDGVVHAGGKSPPCCDIPPIDIPIPPIPPIEPPKIPIPKCVNTEIPNPVYDACIAAVKCSTEAVNGSVCTTNTPPLCAKYRNKDNGAQSFFDQLGAGKLCGAYASFNAQTVATLNDLIQNCIAGSDTPPPAATSEFCKRLQLMPEQQCSSIPKTIGACIPIKW